MTEASKPAQGALELRGAQGDLEYRLRGALARSLGRIPHTASSGPSTSQNAGDTHTDSGRRRKNFMLTLRILYAKGAQGGHGATPRELACSSQASRLGESYADSLFEIRRRVHDLDEAGYAERRQAVDDEGKPMTYASGRPLFLNRRHDGHKPEALWWITTAGLLALSVAEGKGRRA